MNNSNNDHLNILDLPDEILFIIFNKLNMINVFYSLMDVNQRFNRLAFDPVYTRDLDMTVDSVYDQTYSIDTQDLSKICKKILPHIQHQVQKLTVEQYSIKHVFHAANYPQLYSLSLVNFLDEILYQNLIGNLMLRDLLHKQITHLNIDIKKTATDDLVTVSNIFQSILCLCTRLIDLSFGDLFYERKFSIVIPHPLSTSSITSTLIKLKINVSDFGDCLALLDGHLDCLSTLIIYVLRVDRPIRYIDNIKQLPKLKCFSFTVFYRTFGYDALIVPLICRMINLEELNLYLPVMRFDSTYIDGIQLYDQILINLKQLDKFTFSITTEVSNKNVTLELQSNEDIQRSFSGRRYQQVASYVHTKSMNVKDTCHIYSLPYDFEYFYYLNNYFQGGMFHKVRQLKMTDAVPFEHQLFKRISEDLPFLQFLYVLNTSPQKDKQHSSSLITFPHLTLLDITWTHIDYAELFLLEKNAHLPRLLNLCIKYKSLTTITNNFTNDAKHFNFSKLKNLDVCGPFVQPENFHQYFPLL